MTANVTFAGQDVVAACRPGESVLCAGLRAGLRLSYECASGGCGSCRARLLEGSVSTRWAEAPGLNERDRRRGNRVLMCQSVPDGDCTIKAPPVALVEDVVEPVPDRLLAQLTGRDRLTADTALFTVRFDAALRFLPGQFILLESPAGVRRAYSMAHPMRDQDSMSAEFVIRAKPGGAASRWLFDDIGIGDTLVAEGPYGRAYVRSHGSRPVLCIAGGTGLAPILAITEHLLTTDHPPSLHLYVGHRGYSTVILAERIGRLHDMGAVLTMSLEDPTVDGATPSLGGCPPSSVRSGLVLDHVTADWTDLGGHDIYLAGPPAMIDTGLRILVRDRGALADRVFADRFF
ncbi:MAG: 2Fe-2S iron-sulfur cluster-binding protein [Mycobacterium sp.]